MNDRSSSRRAAAGMLRFVRPIASIVLSVPIVFGATWAIAADATADASPVKPIRAMLVTGGCCHDYDTQRKIVVEGFGKHLGPTEWTIHQYAEPKDTRATIYDDPQWAQGYDLIVHNECFGGMADPELVERIVQGHRKYSVPAIFIHCSMHSYRVSSAADSWRELIGVTSTFHEKGKRPLDVIPTPEGKASGLVAAIGDRWTTPNGELYVITDVWPGTTVLATAMSTEQKADQPVIWKRETGGLRVFATTLGHHNETMSHPTWLSVVAAGAAWALQRD